MAIIKLNTVTNKYSGFDFKSEDTVIIIDIYRASSTIVTALANGATEIIPCEEIEQVLNLNSKDSEILSAGERNGKKILGFDMDNSPTSFDSEIVRDRRIALTTTNCTKAIKLAKNSNHIIFASFLNFNSIIEYIFSNMSKIKRLILFCSGNGESESEEDNMFAAELILKMRKTIEFNTCENSERIISQRKKIKDLKQYMETTTHAKRLIGIGKRNDIDFSLIFNKFDCVPIYANDSIKIN